MIVVNLFGAPGSGKSTGAAYIFAKLKMAEINAELVTEFAKDKVYERSAEPFNNQLYIMGQQSFRLSRLVSSVDVAVTDSPMLLSCFYNKVGTEEEQQHFNSVAQNKHKEYVNFNYFIARKKKYSQVGRFQNEAEANEIAVNQKLIYKYMLETLGEDMKVIDGTEEGYNQIVDDIIDRINKRNYAEEDK